ncbi:hypothetical protein ACTOV9_02210 [Legionella pneumophila]|uniref:Uncharacterized protein n=1 Tax=Legionella pneumophila (strain Lens) TaxID=297245 RepID=Q5WXP3_LEGPL|nr:hypothetical protein [Legionella pneumophila]MCK0182719.1 hypothetical protein [Legionella pneumophila]MCK1880296.1 hypothetical protein [Legionella pneumophila]MCK1889619.1 hypothetical protein [Legionella pneumophila]MCW8404343.1 hypothetical protein [Legionella pneumophila]MCW8456986.1 hypothetical protein [Legionella pneumophila]
MVITKRKFFFFFQRKARRPRHNTINANSNTIVKVLAPIIIYPYLAIEVFNALGAYALHHHQNLPRNRFQDAFLSLWF